MYFRLFGIIFVSLLARFDVCGAENVENAIDGCYQPPANIASGALRLTSFKDVLLLGDTVPAPGYVVIKRVDRSYEIWFVNADKVEERYGINVERNRVKIVNGAMTFSTCRSASAEGVKWKRCGVMTLSPSGAGDVHVSVQIVTENRTFFSTKKEPAQISFDLKKIVGCSVDSLLPSTPVSDLPGP